MEGMGTDKGRAIRHRRAIIIPLLSTLPLRAPYRFLIRLLTSIITKLQMLHTFRMGGMIQDIIYRRLRLP